MHHPSGSPDDESGALFGLDALTPGPAAPAAPGTDSSFRTSAAARRLLPVREIYAEPAAAASPRGRQISARFPDARVTEVDSHWRIPGLHGNEGNVERWVRIKGCSAACLVNDPWPSGPAVKPVDGQLAAGSPGDQLGGALQKGTRGRRRRPAACCGCSSHTFTLGPAAPAGSPNTGRHRIPDPPRKVSRPAQLVAAPGSG